MAFNPYRPRFDQLDQEPMQFQIPEPEPWVDMGQPPQIDAGPAAAAFRDRFTKPPKAPTHPGGIPHGGDAPVIPHIDNGASGGHEALAGKMPKSL